MGNNDLNQRFRFNALSVIIYLVGIVIIVQLFNLQIVQGESYRQQSNTKLTRESVLEAARGSIMDRTGNVLVGTNMGFRLELYKTKVDTQTFNNTIYNIIKVLEKNGDSYIDTLPISLNPFAFQFNTDEDVIKWEKKNKITEGATAEQAFYELKDKYGIQNDSIEETRKIMTVIYAIKTTGYSTTKSIELSSNISRTSVQEFSERSEDFPGVAVSTLPLRDYRTGNLASHILGYVGKITEDEYQARKDRYSRDDYVGRTGIESVMEEYLKGENGVRQIDMDVDGTQTGEYISKEAVAGDDVVLTIDSNLQKAAEDALKNNIEKIRNGGFSQRYNAKGGSVVVTNVKTGEILALANYPDYNPGAIYRGEGWNEIRNDASKPLFNRAISGAWAPGSTFKMVTAVAGLETGVINKKEKINDVGVYRGVPNIAPVCWIWTQSHHGHGRLNVEEAIQHSCNYFFYEVGNRMGIDNLDKYVKYFGLGEKTGVELPSETAGTIASKETSQAKGKRWQGGDILNASIGQGDNNFSPIQMARYISILVNGGHRIDLSVIKSVVKADGSEVPRNEIKDFTNKKLNINKEDVEQLDISQDTINTVMEGMKSVAEEAGGTAYNIFKNFNISVGGKTGSAETSTGDVTAWFTGFAPFDDPEIAVVVMVENGGHGNYTAEVARDIISEYFGMNTQVVEENVQADTYTEYAR